MDPKNFNPFSPDWQNAYYAMLAQQQAGQGEQPAEAAQPVFEQHLEEAGQQDAPDYGRRYGVTPQDAALIQRAGDAARGRLRNRTVIDYGTGLRKLSQRLQQHHNLSLNDLGDESLKAYARELCPEDDGRVMKGLNMLRKYRETLGVGTSRAAEGSSRQPVHQPSPQHESSPSRVSSHNQDQLWEAYDAAEVPGDASPPPSDISEGFWMGVDERNELPPQSLTNTSGFWRGMDVPSPAPSVNQPSPSWDQGAEASIFGVAHASYAPPVPDLAIYAPGWQHGNQRAPMHLMRGMHYMGVLPSPSQPQTNFTIDGVPYTAMLGPSGRQNDIHLHRN
ncbi:hypothetical protein EH240_14770 [Mesorhizobium tamadayense]|uniref:Uncharacterized protein n=1 Tax=Mesorhizobium tamadayense TaxID=425306 RepID=A0A3P3FSE7_9HYPH|nr:hypothetical protein [Mesorhizobium tamadayense]RRI01545.1 hypothetical protein EH240_14770 [Mesorhizobium tamadayense]